MRNRTKTLGSILGAILLLAGHPSAYAGEGVTGARAIYSPVPEIPDSLRENTLDPVVVAHFAVSGDGQVHVTLTPPIQNPRLNDLLLKRLGQWRFAPATRDGIAVASEFDIRIPITAQYAEPPDWPKACVLRSEPPSTVIIGEKTDGYPDECVMAPDEWTDCLRLTKPFADNPKMLEEAQKQLKKKCHEALLAKDPDADLTWPEIQAKQKAQENRDIALGIIAILVIGGIIIGAIFLFLVLLFNAPLVVIALALVVIALRLAGC